MKKSNSLLSKAINEAETIRAGAMKNAHEILFNTFQPKIKDLFNEVLKEQVGVVNQDPMNGPNPSKYDQDTEEADLQNPENAMHQKGNGPELLEDEDIDNPDELPEQDDEFEVTDIPEQDDEFSDDELPEQEDEIDVDEIPEQDDEFSDDEFSEQEDEVDDFELPEQDEELPDEDFAEQEDEVDDFELPEQDEELPDEDFAEQDDEFSDDEFSEQEDEELPDENFTEQDDEFSDDEFSEQEDDDFSDELPEDIEVVDDDSVEEQDDVNPSLDQDVKKLANENAHLKHYVRNLKRKNRELTEGIGTLRHRISEVSLFNAKVGAANKIASHKGLTENQRIKMLEAFDKCKNIREVKLTYTNFKNFIKSLQNKRRVTESRNSKLRTLSSKNVATARRSNLMTEEQKKTLKLAGILS